MSENPNTAATGGFDNKSYMPDDKTFKERLDARNRRGRIAQVLFLVALLTGFVALIFLFINIINEAFGTIAVQDERPVPELIEQFQFEGETLDDLTEDQLIDILESEARGGLRLIIRDNLSVVDPTEFTRRPVSEVLEGLNYPEAYADEMFTTSFPNEGLRTIIRDNLDRETVEQIVLEKVVGRDVVASWPLIPTIFNWELAPGTAERIAELEGEIATQQTEVEAAAEQLEQLQEQQAEVADTPEAVRPDLTSDINAAQLRFDELEDQLEDLQADRNDLIRSAITAEQAEFYPDAELRRFHSWLNADFLTRPMNSIPANAGIRTAILGSIYMMLLVVLVSVPVGVGAAIYLNEYANDSWVNRIIETNVRNLAGVPSIIYGLLGLALFVRALGDITNGRTIISGALTLSLLILPVIIVASQEALRSVSTTLREASYGLGATKWQTIWRVVLPDAIPSILTGVIIAVSRAVGETAPLIVVGAASFVLSDPTLTSRFTVLPIQVYQWTARPQPQFRDIAAAAIIVLLMLNLSLTSIAIILRNRTSRAK